MMNPNECVAFVQEGENLNDGGGKGASVVGANQSGDVLEIKIGMLFPSDEEAYNAYSAYGLKKGFGVRKGAKKYNKFGQVTRREMYCSCSGLSEEVKERKRERLRYRCNCRARIIFRVVNGVYEVTHLDDDHNHPMGKYNKSDRDIGQSSKNLIDPTVDVESRPGSTFGYIGNEVGRFQNLEFIDKDYHYFFQQHGQSSISAMDAAFVLDYFRSMQTQDLTFFSAMQLDSEGRLMNFFWRDGMSRLNYEAYRDAIIFDTTYCTSKQNVICASFVAINNHGDNVLLGCALLSDGSHLSFKWLFETFLIAMDGKEPITIFTDQGPSIASALKDVLPSSRHRLCQWHIKKNAMKNIGHLKENSSFWKKFNKLLWHIRGIDEFESTWVQLINEYDLIEHNWLKELYSLKEKWSPAFNIGYFSAEIMYSPRSESRYSVYKQLSGKTMLLSEFVENYEKMSRKMREKELENDHKTMRKPKVLINCGIMNHASRVYTRSMFFRFQKEFLRAMSDAGRAIEKSETGCNRMFTLHSGHVVQFNTNDNSVCCNCHKFETMGYLCSHTLRVLHVDLVLELIPNQYVLKRWTKAAKKGLELENSCSRRYDTLVTPARARLNSLMRRCFFIMSLASQDESSANKAMAVLDELEQKLNTNEQEAGVSSESGQFDFDTYPDSLSSEELILDPETRRKKNKKNITRPEDDKNRKRPRQEDVLPSSQMQNHAAEVGPTFSHIPLSANDGFGVPQPPAVGLQGQLGFPSADLNAASNVPSASQMMSLDGDFHFPLRESSESSSNPFLNACSIQSTGTGGRS